MSPRFGLLFRILDDFAVPLASGFDHPKGGFEVPGVNDDCGDFVTFKLAAGVDTVDAD